MAILHSSFCLLHSPGAPDPPREPRGSLRAASGWLPGGFGVASGQPGMLFRRALAVWRLCWRIVGALGTHSGGFGVAFSWLSTRFGVALLSHWPACAVIRRYFCFLLSALGFPCAVALPGHSAFAFCLLPSAFPRVALPRFCLRSE